MKKYNEINYKGYRALHSRNKVETVESVHYEVATIYHKVLDFS